MSDGPCKKCQSIKAGLRALESDLRLQFYRANARPSLARTIPAAQEKLRAQKLMLQHHDHEAHGAEMPSAPSVVLTDTTPDHGTYKRYSMHKCRCVDCMEANAERSREYYHRAKS